MRPLGKQQTQTFRRGRPLRKADILPNIRIPDGVFAGGVRHHVCGGGNAGDRAHGHNVAAVLQHVWQELEYGPKLRGGISNEIPAENGK